MFSESTTQRYNILESKSELRDFIKGFTKILHCDMTDEQWALVCSIKNAMYSKTNYNNINQKLRLESKQVEHILDLISGDNVDFSQSFKRIIVFRLESILALRSHQIPTIIGDNIFIKKAEFQRLYSLDQSIELAQK